MLSLTNLLPTRCSHVLHACHTQTYTFRDLLRFTHSPLPSHHNFVAGEGAAAPNYPPIDMDRDLEHLNARKGTGGLSDLPGQEEVTVAVERSGQGYQLRITTLASKTAESTVMVIGLSLHFATYTDRESVVCNPTACICASSYSSPAAAFAYRVP